MYYTVYYFGKLETICNSKNEAIEYIKNKNIFISNNDYIMLINRKINNINGYSILKYSDKKYISDTIKFTKKNLKLKNRKNYIDYIFAFDIENSVFTTDEKQNFSVMYLSGFLGCPLDCTINKNNFDKFATKYYSCRNWNEVDNFLYKYNNYLIKNNKYGIIYIHNLSYEFSFFQNSDFFRKYFSNDNMICVNSRIPLKVDLSHIEFRCSYKLIGKSLKSIGKELGIEKITDEKGGYSQHFTPTTVLPEVEFKYNYIDLKITLLGVLNTLKNTNAFKDIKDISSILTITGITRHENKLLSDKKIKNNYATFCKKQALIFNKKLDKNYKVFNLLSDCFTGGYVRANRFFLYQPLRNVKSFDIKSSYPTQMLNRYYPYDFKIIKENKFNFLTEIIKENENYINDNSVVNSSICKDMCFTQNHLSNFYFKCKNIVSPNCFIAKVVIKNLKVRKFNNKNEIPIISLNKINIIDDNNLKIDNGRVLQANEFEIVMNDVDYLIFKICYDFEIFDCQYLIFTPYKQKLNRFILNSVNHFAEQKSIFSNIIKNIDNIKEFKKDMFYSKNLKKHIIDESIIDEFLQWNYDEQVEFLSSQLRLAKGRLNAQYGINVQSILPINYCYNYDTNEWSKFLQDNAQIDSLMRNYTDGIYITSYSRLHLVMLSLCIFNFSNSTIIYWDTDSCKCYHDLDTVENIVKRFNDNLSFAWRTKRRFNFGIYENDDSYDYFCTGGSKSYIYENNNNIYISISGVPKKTASSIFNTLREQNCNSFSDFVKKYYHPNVIICGDLTGKLASGFYKNDENYFDEFITDDFNNDYHFKGYSGNVLIQSDFTIDKIENNFSGYVKYRRILKNTNVNEIATNIVEIGTPYNLNSKLCEDIVEYMETELIK